MLAADGIYVEITVSAKCDFASTRRRRSNGPSRKASSARLCVLTTDALKDTIATMPVDHKV